jgi:hypothetical protein
MDLTEVTLLKEKADGLATLPNAAVACAGAGSREIRRLPWFLMNYLTKVGGIYVSVTCEVTCGGGGDDTGQSSIKRLID